MKTALTKAFENFSHEYLSLNPATIQQHKVIDCIKACKTKKLCFSKVPGKQLIIFLKVQGTELKQKWE